MTEGVFMFNLVWFTRTLQIVSYRHPASFHSSTLVFKATVNSENQIFLVLFPFSAAGYGSPWKLRRTDNRDRS